MVGLRASPSGEVVEWLMALVLKTSDAKASVGSNPTLSVSHHLIRAICYPTGDTLQSELHRIQDFKQHFVNVKK